MPITPEKVTMGPAPDTGRTVPATRDSSCCATCAHGLRSTASLVEYNNTTSTHEPRSSFWLFIMTRWTTLFEISDGRGGRLFPMKCATATPPAQHVQSRLLCKNIVCAEPRQTSCTRKTTNSWHSLQACGTKYRTLKTMAYRSPRACTGWRDTGSR